MNITFRHSIKAQQTINSNTHQVSFCLYASIFTHIRYCYLCSSRGYKRKHLSKISNVDTNKHNFGTHCARFILSERNPKTTQKVHSQSRANLPQDHVVDDPTRLARSPTLGRRIIHSPTAMCCKRLLLSKSVASSLISSCVASIETCSLVRSS